MPTITISLRSFSSHFLLAILSSWSTLKAWEFDVLLQCSHNNVSFRSTILPDTSRKSRQKTRAVGKTTNPVFNHTMVYDGFRPEDLTEACVELTVWDHYKLTNQFLGGLRIGFGTGNMCYIFNFPWVKCFWRHQRLVGLLLPNENRYSVSVKGSEMNEWRNVRLCARDSRYED